MNGYIKSKNLSLLILFTVSCQIFADTGVSNKDYKSSLKIFFGDMRGGYIRPSLSVADQVILALATPDATNPVTPKVSTIQTNGKTSTMLTGCRYKSCTEKSAVISEDENIIGVAIISNKCSNLHTVKRPSGCDSFSTLTIFLPQKAPNFSAVKLLLDWGNEKSPGLNVEYRAIK